MAPSGGGDETDRRGGPHEGRGVCRGVDDGATAGQNIGVESGNRKRRAMVMSRNCNNLVENREDLEVTYGDSEMILLEIENLRCQLDEDVEELGYCEENEKLRVELALKAKETQCLRKQCKELQAKYECLHKKIVEILENQIDTKRIHLLQFERLIVTMEFPYAQLEEDKKRLHSSSKLVDELVAVNSVSTKAYHDKSTHQLELEVAKLDAEIQAKMEKLSEMLELTIFSEELSRDLSKKERESNIELQQARKELIMGLKDELTGRTTIGIKRMGELDEKPFRNSCREKYGNDDYKTEAAELVSTWQEEIEKPSWYPFKIIVQFDGEAKEVIDDDDANLRYLLTEYGDDVCNAVKTALIEINEYNPSGRYIVPELWNFRKGRKAAMKEVVRYLLQQMETTSRRKGRLRFPGPCHHLANN